MIPRLLADSSIWIDHINIGDPDLVVQLKRHRIVLHPMIIGEIALGSIARRKSVLGELEAMPQLESVSHAEVIAIIEELELASCGIGYVDAHLLAAVRRSRNTRLWTRDRRLREQAERINIAADLSRAVGP